MDSADYLKQNKKIPSVLGAMARKAKWIERELMKNGGGEYVQNSLIKKLIKLLFKKMEIAQGHTWEKRHRCL